MRINAFVFTFSKLSSDHCKLAKAEDEHDVNKRSCPPAEDGQVSKCVILNGTVSTSLYLKITRNSEFFHASLFYVYTHESSTTQRPFLCVCYARCLSVSVHLTVYLARALSLSLSLSLSLHTFLILSLTTT